MSKFADALREIKVYNNWGMLLHFGNIQDVAIEYRSADGRMGVHHTSVWSPRPNTKLEPPKLKGNGHVRVFYGLRRNSLPSALQWARDQFGHDYDPSPFGGYLPRHVISKAKSAVKNGHIT